MKKILLFPALCFSLVLTYIVMLSTSPAFAQVYGDGDYGACTYNNCGISLTTSGTVNINVTPVGGATTCSDNSDSVGVTTDSSTGYTLTLGDSDTNTNLVGGSHGGNIPAISGTPSSPTVLTANTWGYRVDGLSGFGSGPTTVGNNTSPLGLGFAGIESSSNTPDTISTTSSPADPAQTTTVWYGICANSSLVADTYSDTVTYTAVVN